MRKAIFLLIVISLLASVVMAQEGEPIEYGQVVTGEITNRQFEVLYTFSGSADDVIIIEMEPVETLGDLNSPEIILLDADGNILTDTSGAFSFGSALLAAQLPEDGDFTIIATRADGRAGDSVGEYTLQLINPPALQPGDTVSESISSEDRNHYYAVSNDGSDLTLAYTKLEGDYAPEITLNRIGSDGELDPVVSLSGNELEQGMVNVPRTTNLRSGSAVFIVSLGAAAFDFNFREVTADYELTLTSAE